MALIEIKHYDKSIFKFISSTSNDLELKSIVEKNIESYSTVASFSSDKSIGILLDDAVNLSKNLSNYKWFKNDKLTIPDEIKEGCRSTSIGDLIVIDGSSFLLTSNHFIGLE